MPKRRTPLSAPEAAFVRHFLGSDSSIRGNGTRSAIAAGYAPRTCHITSWVKLNAPNTPTGERPPSGGSYLGARV